MADGKIKLLGTIPLILVIVMLIWVANRVKSVGKGAIRGGIKYGIKANNFNTGGFKKVSKPTLEVLDWFDPSVAFSPSGDDNYDSAANYDILKPKRSSVSGRQHRRNLMRSPIFTTPKRSSVSPTLSLMFKTPKSSNVSRRRYSHNPTLSPMFTRPKRSSVTLIPPPRFTAPKLIPPPMFTAPKRSSVTLISPPRFTAPKLIPPAMFTARKRSSVSGRQYRRDPMRSPIFTASKRSRVSPILSPMSTTPDRSNVSGRQYGRNPIPFPIFTSPKRSSVNGRQRGHKSTPYPTFTTTKNSSRARGRHRTSTNKVSRHLEKKTAKNHEPSVGSPSAGHIYNSEANLCFHCLSIDGSDPKCENSTQKEESCLPYCSIEYGITSNGQKYVRRSCNSKLCHLCMLFLEGISGEPSNKRFPLQCQLCNWINCTSKLSKEGFNDDWKGCRSDEGASR